MIVVKQQSVEALILKELGEKRGLDEIMERFKNSVVVATLTRTNGNIKSAALILKMRHDTLRDYMKESDILQHFPDTADERRL